MRVSDATDGRIERWKDGRKHVQKYGWKDGWTEAQTEGLWEVESVEGRGVRRMASLRGNNQD